MSEIKTVELPGGLGVSWGERMFCVFNLATLRLNMAVRDALSIGYDVELWYLARLAYLDIMHNGTYLTPEERAYAYNKGKEMGYGDDS